MDNLPVDHGGNPPDHRTLRARDVVANEDALIFPGFDIDAVLDNLNNAGYKMLLQQDSSAGQMSKDRRVLKNLVVIGRTAAAYKAVVNSADFCEMVAEGSGISYDKTTRAAAVENILQAYVHARSLVVPSGRPSPNSLPSALTTGFDELVALRHEYMQSIGIGPADLAALQASWKQLLKSRISGYLLEPKSNETLVDDFCKEYPKSSTGLKKRLRLGFSSDSITGPLIPMKPVPAFLRDPGARISQNRAHSQPVNEDDDEDDDDDDDHGNKDHDRDNESRKRRRLDQNSRPVAIKEEPQEDIIDQLDRETRMSKLYNDLRAEKQTSAALRQGMAAERRAGAELQERLATEQQSIEELRQEVTAYRQGIEYLVAEDRELRDNQQVLRGRIQELENERARDHAMLQGMTTDNRHQAEMIRQQTDLVQAGQRSEYAAFVALNMVLDDNTRLSRRLNERDNVQE